MAAKCPREITARCGARATSADPLPAKTRNHSASSANQLVPLSTAHPLVSATPYSELRNAAGSGELIPSIFGSPAPAYLTFLHQELQIATQEG